MVGRPEGSTAGGAGPEPVLLSTSATCTFTVDDDSTLRRDGTYLVRCTVNAGTSTETQIQAIMARLSGLTLSGGRTLRKPAAFETLGLDTSVANTNEGWAIQYLRWLEYVRTQAGGTGANTNLTFITKANETGTAPNSIGLSTLSGPGLLKFAADGTPSKAVSGTDYQLPVSAADGTIVFPTATTVRVGTLTNKFIVQGTADAQLSGAQFLGALGTGIVKNTTTTGVLSIAAANTDFPAVNATYLVASATNAPPSAVNLGALGSGFVKSTVSVGVATISIDTNTYLTSASLSAYLTITSAAATYLTISTAAATYQPLLTPADPSITFPTTSTIKVGTLASQFIVRGTADAQVPNAQFLGALTTGLLKNTTATGVLSIAVANTDFPSLDASYLVASSTNAPPSAINLGALASGLVRITVSGGTATVSSDTTAYLTVATATTTYQPILSATAGSVLFSGGTDVISQDNPNFFWDNTNKRLGLRTNAAPQYQLHLVDQAAAADRGIYISTYDNGATSGPLQTFQVAKGTLASPALVDATKYGGRLGWEFWDGTQWLHTANFGSHVTFGSTPVAGTVPTDLYAAINQTGVTDTYGTGTNVVQWRLTPWLTGTGGTVIVGGQVRALPQSQQSAIFYGNVQFGGALSTPTLSSLGTVEFQGAATAIFNELRHASTNSASHLSVAGETLGMRRWYGGDGGASYVRGVAERAWVDYGATVTTGNIFGAWGIFVSDENGAPKLYVGPNGDVIAGSWTALSTNATGGFFHFTSMPGVPTGVPSVPSYGLTSSSAVAHVADTTNNRLYAYFGHWAPIGQDTTAMSSGFLKNTTSTGVWSVDTSTYIASGSAAGGDLGGTYPNPTVVAIHTGATQLTIGSVADGQVLVRSGTTVIGSGIASTSATYILQTPSAGLTSAQALSALATGIMKSTTATGVVSIAVAGTDYQAPLSAADATITFPTASTVKVGTLANKFIVQGTADAQLSGAQFLGALATGVLKSTTSTGVLSIAVANTDYASPAATYLVASSVSAPTNAVNLGALGSGFVKSTVSVGVATISIDTNTYLTTAAAAATYMPLLALTNRSVLVSGGGAVVVEDNTNFQYNTSSHALTAHHLVIPGSDGSSVAVNLNQSGTQSILKVSGTLGFGTGDNNPLSIATNNTTRLVIDGSGSISVSAFTAGGLVLAAATTGVLGLATPTDVAAAITWPASPRVLISGGISATPVGDSHFLYDTSTHTLTSSGSNTLAQTTLSGITTLSSLAGAATLLAMDISGVVQAASVGDGLTYSGLTLSSAVSPSSTLVYNYNIAGANSLGGTNNPLMAGMMQSYPVGGQGPQIMSTSGGSGSTCEYALGVAATRVTLRAHITRNDVSNGGVGDMAWTVTKNNTFFSSSTLHVTQGAGAQDLSTTITVAGSITDTYGVSYTGSGGASGALTGTITLTVYPF